MRIRHVLAAVLVAGAWLCDPSAPVRAQGQLQMLEPWQTVQLEHSDRKARLVRLANLRGIDPPEFYEYAITPAEHGLAAYPTNIPVLRVVFREGVLFEFNRDEIRPEAAEILNLIAASLRLEPPDVTLFVAGHTDAIGSVDYNLGLGMRRARAIARALAIIGVNRAQLYAISFGKAVPIAPNDTDEGRSQNRRVEFLFGARPEAVAGWILRQQVMPCGDRRYTFAQECPTHVRVPAESVVAIPAPPRTRIDPAVHETPVPLKNPAASVPVRSPVTDVRIGERVVDIDLTEKVFHMRAPE